MSLIYEALRKSEREKNQLSQAEIFSERQRPLMTLFSMKRLFLFFLVALIIAISGFYITSKTDLADISKILVKFSTSPDKILTNSPTPENKPMVETNYPIKPPVSTVSWEDLFSQALTLEDKGFLDKAIELYQEAKKTKSNHVPIYMNLGRIYFQKGLNDQAIDEFKEATSLSPLNSKAYNNLGTAYFKKGWHHLAILEYKKALEVDPKYALVHYNLSSLHAQTGEYENYDLALTYLEEAIKSNPQIRRWAKDDPDFTGLKNLSRFQELIKER